jgi:tetratricopeptide (TPR) repeat protein
MKYQKVFYGVLVAILIAAGSVVAYRFLGSRPVDNNTLDNKEIFPSPSPAPSGIANPTVVQDVPPIPVGYDIVNPDPKLSSSARENFMKQFNTIVEKIKKIPNSTWNWLDLGSVKYALGDYKGAEAAWIYATKLSPEHSPAYNNLGQLYWHDMPDYSKAEAMFQKFVALEPTAVGGYRDLADMYRYNYKEKQNQIIPVILNGLSNNPNSPDLLSYLGLYYYETGDRAHAIEYYEKLVKAAPNNKQAKDDLEDLKAGRNIGDPR